MRVKNWPKVVNADFDCKSPQRILESFLYNLFLNVIATASSSRCDEFLGGHC
jgi:hypothetical protein